MAIHDFHPPNWKDSEARTEILQDIEDDIEKGIKYILLEAPTGIGKSWIAATVARVRAAVPAVEQQTPKRPPNRSSAEIPPPP